MMSHRRPLSGLFALLLLPCAVYSQGPIAPGALLDAADLAWQITPEGSFSALPGTGAFDTEDALGIAADALQSSILQTSVTGPGLVSWYWRRNKSGPGNPSLKLFFVYDGNRLADHDDDERWEKVVIQIPAGQHNLQWQVPPGPLDDAERAAVDLVTVYPAGLLPESAAMSDPNGVWIRTELGTAWGITLTNTHGGPSAAEARPALRDQATSLRRLVNGPGEVSWWWQLQGHDGNELKAKLRKVKPDDTTLISRWDLTAATPWQRVTTFVPAGPHVINWRYEYDDPAATVPIPSAAGQLDEFSATLVTLNDALGLPNQTWNFGGTWQVGMPSADTATVGSLYPETLTPEGSAWIESSFTGPVVVRWSQQPSGSAVSFSLDGVPARGALVRAPPPFGLWETAFAIIPAGLHVVRWTFLSTTVRFDHPEVLPPMAENLRAVLGAPGAAFFENGTPASQMVSNAPNGPEGNTALRLSGTNTPLLVIGESSPMAGPRVISYFHRRVGGNTETLLETGLWNGDLQSGPEWKKRTIFLAKTLALGWDARVSGGAAFELDGFSFDAPAANAAAFLARTGMNWTAPAGAAAGRVLDESLPAPQGEVLFLTSSPAVPLTAQVNGPGVFEMEVTDRFRAPNQSVPPSATQYVTANGKTLNQVAEELPDRKRFRFAVPDGLQTLALSGDGTAVLRLAWLPAGAPVLTELVHDGLEGDGLTFFVTDPAALQVRDADDISPRRVLTLRQTWPPAELRTTVTGPGTLSFEWSSGGEFSVGTPPVMAAEADSDRWSKVRVAIPPGTQVLRWSTAGSLDIDQVQWEPHAPAANPPAGILGSAVRTGGELWREHRNSGGETLVVPQSIQEAVQPPVIFNVNGPGVFVCEVRVLITHYLSHFTMVDGVTWVEIFRDAETVSGIMGSEEWIPVAVPLGSEPFEISARVRADPEGVSGMLPATLEIRNAAVVPARTAAAVAKPGITWQPVPASQATAAEFNTDRGNSVVWHLAAPAAAGEPPVVVRPALTAAIEGPGTLEWESSHETGQVTLSSNEGPPRDLHGMLTPFYAFMPSHQLVLPAGTHRVTLTQYHPTVFVYAPGSGALSMALRWLPSVKPPLAAVMPPPLVSPLYFLSDGGWEPAPFDPATPWQRLRTRLAGPAQVRLMLPEDNERRQVWAIHGDAGFDQAAAALEQGELFGGGEQWLTFSGPAGGPWRPDVTLCPLDAGARAGLQCEAGTGDLRPVGGPDGSGGESGRGP